MKQSCRVTGIVAVCMLMAAAASAQVAISPQIVDFGEVGTSLVGGVPYTRFFSITNTSTTNALTIHKVAVIDRPYYEGRNWRYLHNGISLEIVQEVQLKPGDSRRYIYTYNSWDPIEHWTDSVYVVVSYPGDAKRDTLYVPVQARSANRTVPFLVGGRTTDRYYCNCWIQEGQHEAEYTGGLYIYLYNVGADTLRLDSVTTSAITPGLILTDSVYSYDVIDTLDSVGNWPPGHWSRLPREILPTMPLYINFTIAGAPPGRRFALVRAHLTNKRTGEHFTLEDTADAAILSYPFPLLIQQTHNEIYLRFNEVDSSSDLKFYLWTCSTPDGGSVTLENVEFRGPRAKELKLLPGVIGNPPPTFPSMLECNRRRTYRTLFRPTKPGNTIDTLWVRYSYFDTTKQQNVTDSSYAIYYFYISGPLSVPVERSTSATGVLAAWPNPATAMVQVQWNTSEQKVMREVRAQLYNSLGQDVLGHEIGLDERGNGSISIAGLPAGIYTVVARNRDAVLGTTTVVIVR